MTASPDWETPWRWRAWRSPTESAPSLQRRTGRWKARLPALGARTRDRSAGAPPGGRHPPPRLPGHELEIAWDLADALAAGNALPLADSRFVLLETPYFEVPDLSPRPGVPAAEPALPADPGAPGAEPADRARAGLPGGNRGRLLLPPGRMRAASWDCSGRVRVERPKRCSPAAGSASSRATPTARSSARRSSLKQRAPPVAWSGRPPRGRWWPPRRSRSCRT